MSNRLNDPLLNIGKLAAVILQGLAALATGLFFLLALMVVLNSLGILPDFFGESDGPDILIFPLPGISLALVLALLCAALFLFFGRLRAFIRTVAEGDPFIPENAQRLNAMAWLVLGIQILAFLVAALRNHLAALALRVESSGFYFDFDRRDMVGILMVIVLFILARVFRHGAAMREDLEGTV